MKRMGRVLLKKGETDIQIENNSKGEIIDDIWRYRFEKLLELGVSSKVVKVYSYYAKFKEWE